MSELAYQTGTFVSSRQQQRTWRRNQNTVRFSVGNNLGPVAHTVLVTLMLVILGLVYLTQVNKTGSYSYELNGLQNKQDELVSQQQDLKVENARLQALQTVKNSNVAQAMTTPAHVDYAQN